MKRFAVCVCSVVVGTACLAVGVSSASAAAHARTLTLYATAEQEQYVDNSDSLQLGEGNNPFGNYKDLEPLANKNANGPFPGDEALFSFNLYTGPNLVKRAGTALFTCQYNFNKNAFCDVSYQLKGGTMIGGGTFNFNASTFAIAITGGTGAYRSSHGQVTASAASGVTKAQRLQFVLDS